MVEGTFVQVIICAGILLFAAKMLSELFMRIHLPLVLGELIAGMIVGPFALGAYLIYEGRSIMEISHEVTVLGEIGAIIILFMAGLEMTPRDFLRGGKAAFTVGTLGVVVPFFAGFAVFQLFGFDALQSMLIATALTATSIAISVQVLNEFGKLRSKEAKLIIGAAVVDDILAIAVLSVVTSLAGAGSGTTLDPITGTAEVILDVQPLEVMFTILQVLGFFAAMLLASIFLVPRLVAHSMWQAKGSMEAIVTASFFGAAALAGSLGLSPIVGAFAVGMALSTSKYLKQVELYIDKLGIIFSPLFFAIIGAQVNLLAVDAEILMLAAVMISIAIATKFFGCGLPAWLFLRNKRKGMRVGIGMISRGEVGLIVAGIGVSSGIMTDSVYSTIIIMVIATTIITPIWLKLDYGKKTRPSKTKSAEDADIIPP